MELTELIAENIVNRLSSLLKKKISVANLEGQVLASTDLAETHKEYEQFERAIQSKKELELTGTPDKNNLGTGLVMPITYSGQIIGAIFIEDKPEEYRHYRHIIIVTVELLIHQSMVIDDFPYKEKIKDNFVFGYLHRQLSLEDEKVREEAEMFDINLQRDKIVVKIYVEKFWETLFGDKLSASEEEKQQALSEYKRKIYEVFGKFFGRLSGCTVAYFGSDRFVVLLDELYTMDGHAMVEKIRNEAENFKRMILAQFQSAELNKVAVSLGSFYRGKEGPVLAHEEAVRAMNLGLGLGEEKAIYHIDDLGMIATLAGGNKKWQDNFVRRLLSKLFTEEYLLETMEVFFDKNMSLTQTAKDLKIHRNTLLYRLDKIKSITCLDPRKFNNAMELKVALILYKIIYPEKDKHEIKGQTVML